MAAFGVATLGMIGMLPLNTFWGKYYLMKGSVAAGMWPFALVLTGSGIINAVCFIPVVVNAFRGEKAHTNSGQKTGVALMLAPTLILVVIALFTGLWPGMVWQFRLLNGIFREGRYFMLFVILPVIPDRVLLLLLNETGY